MRHAESLAMLNVFSLSSFQNDPDNEISRNHEEYIDPDEAARKKLGMTMKKRTTAATPIALWPSISGR
jgi:hypothetical protein